MSQFLLALARIKNSRQVDPEARVGRFSSSLI